MRETSYKRPTDEQMEQWRQFWQGLSPDSDHHTMRFVGLLRRTAHTLRQISEASLAEAGLSFAQYRFLMMLHFSEKIEGVPALNPSELSERQGISRNTVSSLLANLERDGLVERELDQKDRRRFLIKITDKGRQLVQTHTREHFIALDECFSILTGPEMEAVGQVLEKLNESPAFHKQVHQ